MKKNAQKIILDLYGGTASWSKPYADAGYDVRVITLPQCDATKTVLDYRGVLRFYSPDDKLVHAIDPAKVYGILSAPPCTHFSMLNRMHTTPRDLTSAMRHVRQTLEIIWACQYANRKLAFWAIENPKARLRWFLGKPALSFNPYDFGNPHRKATDIWGNFNELKKKPVPMDTSHRKHSHLSAEELPPVPEGYVLPGVDKRTIARSITPSGFAYQFFKANP